MQLQASVLTSWLRRGWIRDKKKRNKQNCLKNPMFTGDLETSSISQACRRPRHEQSYWQLGNSLGISKLSLPAGLGVHKQKMKGEQK